MYPDIPIIEEVPEKGGYYEIYPDKKIWHEDISPFGKEEEPLFDEPDTEEDKINQQFQIASNNMKWKSKEQLDAERPKYPPLVAEDYRLTITSYEEKVQPKYMKPNETEDVVNFTLEVQSYRDGNSAYDTEGNEATNRKVFFTFRPDNMGFRQSGEPAISRAFIAYATGQDIDGDLEIESYEQLMGKEIFAQIIQKENKKGDKVNRIARFLPTKTKRPEPKKNGKK